MAIVERLGVLVERHKIGLVVPTFERPGYLRRTLASLKSTIFAVPTVVVFVDDGSRDQRTRELIREFRLPGITIERIFQPINTGFGVHISLRLGFELLVDKYRCTHLCNLDSDAIARPDWLVTLYRLHEAERRCLGPLWVTGFNATSHPVISTHSDHYVKRSCGGLNSFFDVALYRELVRNNLRYSRASGYGWDWLVVWALRRRSYPILCTRPSVVQHIGRYGVYSGPKNHDRALDFGYLGPVRTALHDLRTGSVSLRHVADNESFHRQRSNEAGEMER